MDTHIPIRKVNEKPEYGEVCLRLIWRVHDNS